MEDTDFNSWFLENWRNKSEENKLQREQEMEIAQAIEALFDNGDTESYGQEFIDLLGAQKCNQSR